MKNERDRCIALGGLFQAAELASQVARRGLADTAATEASIHSLFMIDADTVESVYGGLPGVALGLRTIVQQLQNGTARNAETTRYVIALIHLEGKLRKNPSMVEKLGQGIQTNKDRTDHFPNLHANILAGLAELYAQTISTLKPRIMVQGEPVHLQNSENIDKIRALLLAGIRSAMLWRQCGGGKLQILLGRKRLLERVRSLVSLI